MTTKQRADLLAKLGYGGNNENPYEIIEWMNVRKSTDIVCLPIPNYKWEYVIVFLGKPRKDDGKLNVIYGERKYSGKKNALFAGIDFALSSMDEAYREMDEMSDEEKKARYEEAKKIFYGE